MLDEKRIKEIKNRIERYIKENVIIKDKSQFVEFFLSNSINSMASAKLLFDVSTKSELKSYLGLPMFNGHLWVVNASYYSMFYIVRALLESSGIKIKTELSIHSVVFDALVYYFYLTGKLERSLIEDFGDAKDEFVEIQGKEKAKELVEDYFHEKEKRSKFTYEMGEIAMKNKALTSLERAKRFNEKIRKILEEK